MGKKDAGMVTDRQQEGSCGDGTLLPCAWDGGYENMSM